jgi:small subunit ribosomal protein S1
MRVGDVINAKVTHLESFGAFCDIGCGIIALLPIDSISVSRISHPSDRFVLGQHIKAVVKSREEPLDIRGNVSSGRISLSHKELLGTWLENANRFKVGQTVAGIVRSIENYGIFVELAPNLAGLAEIKEGTQRCGFERDSLVAVYIKSIIPERMKIKLVLIDSYVEENENKPIKYYVDCEHKKHISSWRYSPNCCSKIIETVFD